MALSESNYVRKKEHAEWERTAQTSSVRRQTTHFVDHIIEKSFRGFNNHHTRIHSFRMLQIPTELPALEKIVDTFHDYSICIKVNNWRNSTVLEHSVDRNKVKACRRYPDELQT